MNQWTTWHTGKMIDKAVAALKNNGFRAVSCADTEEAAGLIMEEAAQATSVGFGGSVSLVEMGLPAMMAEAGKECLIHGAPDLTPEERVTVMRRQLTCDLFLTGANGVTLDGMLVNVDATGNRVGAMAFGPGKVIAVAGANKLVADAQEGLERIKAWSAPPNANRLGMKTPCATTGVCVDCDSPQRICRIVHLMEKCPRLTDILVVLVNEPMGL